ncbi:MULTISPECIES: hypothetical protein [Actinomadura]|uniref:Uncharacterized protein n=1 Tax=Actinomadura yumaensis TaxID=111807 RepID=A0ABW2D073_9ACTN|nr:hypothetical protein [Actinomadura sp. J1-007]MWK35491.1 hypothetical protein [Actinomadura sp. J1-007]
MSEHSHLGRSTAGQPWLYVWDVEPYGTANGGECGVTGDESAAIGHLRRALGNAPPGTAGAVSRVRPSPSGRAVYIYLGTVAQGRRDQASGVVIYS